MFTYQFRWDVISSSFPFLMSGLGMTLMISAATLVLALLGGLLIALMNMSRFAPIRWIAVGFGEIIRNTPILVQLLWVYYVLPIVFEFRISAITACIIGLSIYSSAFIAEAYRAGIQAIPKGQRESAQVLGLTSAQAFWRIVFPQAIRIILPPLATNFVLLIKYLVARLGRLGRRDHAPGHGAVVLDLPAAGNLHLHRRGLFLHLLAAHHVDPGLGIAHGPALTMAASAARASLKRRLAETRGDLLDMARKLVAAPSANPPGDTREAARVAKSLLQAIPGIELVEVEPRPGFVSIAARIAGARPGRRLVFNGHLDTFPVGDAGQWRHDPLGGAVEAGRLFGRGASDMKGGIAASILALRLLAERRAAIAGEVAITLAADEESMGPHGTKHMLDHVPFARGDAMICGDAGSPSVLRFGEKGLLWIEIEATGKPAHGAHVHLGDNAIDRLRAALDRLAALRDIKVKAPVAVAAAIRRSRKISEPLSGKGEARTLGSVTVNIGTIAGGISPNLVPATAKAAADIRVPVGVTQARMEKSIARRLGKLPGVRYRILRRFEPNWTDPGHEIMRLCAANAKAATGKPVAVNMRVGASDARWYRLYGIPTVVYGLAPHNMGGPDEYVTLADLHAVAEVHALTAFDFLQER